MNERLLSILFFMFGNKLPCSHARIDSYPYSFSVVVHVPVSSLLIDELQLFRYSSNANYRLLNAVWRERNNDLHHQIC